MKLDESGGPIMLRCQEYTFIDGKDIAAIRGKERYHKYFIDSLQLTYLYIPLASDLK